MLPFMGLNPLGKTRTGLSRFLAVSQVGEGRGVPRPGQRPGGLGLFTPLGHSPARRGYSFYYVLRIRGEKPSRASRHARRGPLRRMSGPLPWAGGGDVLREARVYRVRIQSTGGDHRVRIRDGDPLRRVPGCQPLQLHAPRAGGREGHRGLRRERGGGGARKFQRRF